jgi:predicted CXXCH cytochrome family protein
VETGAHERVRRLTVSAAALAAVALGAFIWWRSAPPPPASAVAAPATYVGSQTCSGCHQDHMREWASSQHAHAMAVATEASVAGRFDGSGVTFGGVTSTFFRRDGKFLVRTDAADGHLAEFDIAFAFGVAPLQQYLIAMPDGRLQALSLAWDTRAEADGGQRWFHLYADDVPPAGHALHWTGRQQNWNFMCADCHSTNVRKGYDQATRQFATTWSEISVGCESCHGPGSEHAAMARSGRSPAEGYGLTARLTDRRGVSWSFDASRGVPVRSGPPSGGPREIEVCARCHSRRAQLTDDWKAGDPLEDGFRPSAIESLLYHPDGQQRDEVYTYGSFLQSRMFAKGVTCSDCHNPHTGTLRRPGNATCTQCHQDPRFDSPAHHFHPAGSAASGCTTCHMPTTTYMTVDPRHDHRFGIPRPDLTSSLGVPNACSTCHTDKTPAWAAAQIQQRTGRPPGPVPAALAFAAAADGADAGPSLRAIAVDGDQPPIVRSGAIGRFLSSARPHGLPLAALLGEPEPMVRRTTLQMLRAADEPLRLRLAVPLLSDPVKSVRIEAAHVLADLGDRSIADADRARFEAAFAELVAEHRFNADRPEAQTNLGTAWMARGRPSEAIAAFSEAVRLDPTFSPAWVNLSDVQRLQNDDVAAHQTLRRALAINPGSAAIRHALGLALVRQRRMAEATEELGRAAQIDPSSARYSYVYAVALHDAGRADEAMRVLRASVTRNPEDADTWTALALYSEQAGRRDDARLYAERLLSIRPGDAGAAELARRFGSTPPTTP